MTQENLGLALRGLGERESGTANLEAAVAAHREAMKERTRDRVPLDWATSFGNEGVALMLLAERRGDVAMAETAVSQINTALETMRESGPAQNTAEFELMLSTARALISRLRGKCGRLHDQSSCVSLRSHLGRTRDINDARLGTQCFTISGKRCATSLPGRLYSLIGCPACVGQEMFGPASRGRSCGHP